MLLALALALATDLVPLNDLGPAPYAYGYFGGLYEDGSNVIPADHLAAGLRRASLIRPLDANGNPSANGKVVLLSAGFGETARIADAFAAMAASDRRVDRQSLVILDAARDGDDSRTWVLPAAGANFDRVRDQVLAPAGVTEKQVQAAWVEMMTEEPAPPLPPQWSDAYRLKGDIAAVLRALKSRYPNLQVAYLSSRVYAGYSTSSDKPEPYAYESALSVRWVIMGQVTLMRTGYLWDTRISDVDYEKGTAPWAAWGPYFWANGATPRADGLTWERDDFEADGATLSDAGARKAATLLLDFLLQEPTAANWFRAANVPARARAARP